VKLCIANPDEIKNHSLASKVTHTCSPSYLEGRDQEDPGSKPAWANQFMRPYLEKNLHKKGLVKWFKV
jgi:hypothetical protein